MGFDVVLMAEMYPDGLDQEVGDDQWIAETSTLGLVALTKDANIVHAHRSALEWSTLRLFTLPRANLTGQQMADRFCANMHRIVQRCAKPGPYVFTVMPTSLEKRWPK